MRRRTWVSLTVVAVIVAALVVVVYLRKKAPPEVARLLPEANAIVYIDLKPVRTFTHFDRHPAPHDPSYQAFIDATGIEFERDLDEAAFAMDRMDDPSGPNGAVAYSEVFRGRFSRDRLTHYLAAQAASTEQYGGRTIYSIPHGGRTVRVTILGYDLVAVSNTPSTKAIHSIIDHHHSAASPLSGSKLLARYYHDVPLLSEAWGIGQLALPISSGQAQVHVFGIPVPIPADSTFIASVRFLGSLHLFLEEIAPSEHAAKQTTEMVNLALGFLRPAAEAAVPQNIDQKDWTDMLHSITVKQEKNRAILRAKVPLGLLRSLSSNVSAQPALGGSPQPATP